ncbi:MAG: sulfotransferase [Rhizomicrobium sp.]
MSEVSPYYSVVRADVFSPTTPLEQYFARHNRELPRARVLKALEDHFKSQLRALAGLVPADKKLILREWSHGDFFVSSRFSSSVLPLLDFCEVTGVVLLRNPVDCFLSGKTYDAWSMIGSDVREFCRRYHKFCCVFLNNPALVNVKYEEFAADPDRTLERLCEKLGLAFNPDYQRELGRHRLSGSSGRFSTDRIAPRPRRFLSEAEKRDFLSSGDYLEACALAGYPADLATAQTV